MPYLRVTPTPRPQRRRTLGAYPGDPCYDSLRPSWLPGWIPTLTEFNCNASQVNKATAAAGPLSWAGTSAGSLPNQIANIYEVLEYGHIPAPSSFKTPSPVPPRNLISPGPTGGPESAATMNSDQAAAIQAAIQQAEDSGDYVPAGKLPISATDLLNLNFSLFGLPGWAVVGLGALMGVVVLKEL